MSGFEHLTTMLSESGLDLTEHEQLQAVSFTHEGDNGTWTTFCRVRDPLPQVAVYSLHPRDVPEDRRETMVELITRANYGLIVGNFEIDLGDGELRFKTSLDFGSDRLTGSLLASLIEHNLASFDRYLPAIEAVLAGGDDAGLLIEHLEREAAATGAVRRT